MIRRVPQDPIDDITQGSKYHFFELFRLGGFDVKALPLLSCYSINNSSISSDNSIFLQFCTYSSDFFLRNTCFETIEWKLEDLFQVTENSGAGQVKVSRTVIALRSTAGDNGICGDVLGSTVVADVGLFYQEDIVQRTGSPNSYGIVLRCWHDAEELPPPHSFMDPLMRPLEPGEVGVSFFPNGVREILPESEFVLVDRTFQAGDYCKRSVDDVRSGVVTAIEVMARLVHAVSGASVEGWKSTCDLEHSMDVDIGDYVVYNDWVGQLFDENIVEMSGGQLVRLPELSSRLTVGDKGSDILPPPTASLQSIFSFAMGTNRPSNLDTVVQVKHTVLAVCWLAVNQSLDPEVAEAQSRPDRFWHGESLSKLMIIRTRTDDIRVGDKVFLKNDEGVSVTTHGQSSDPAGIVTVRTLAVKETRTRVTVLWQDGTAETIQSTALIPYMNPDEYDCWPGDHVLWRNEDQKRTAVVQSVNAADRIATIRFTDTGTTELASVLELDPNGMSDLSLVTAHPHIHGLGVRRGDSVFIHKEGSTNSVESPRVPRIGEIEHWVRELPVSSDGQLGGWRREMSDIGARIATDRMSGDPPESRVQQPPMDDTLSWFGEVTGLRLDGSVEVTHPNMKMSVYPLERLTKLYDSLEQFEDDAWDDEMSEDQESVEEGGGVWFKEEDGVWKIADQGGDGDEWVETDDEDSSMDVDPPSWHEPIATAQPVNGINGHPPPQITTISVDSSNSADSTTASPASSSATRILSPDVVPKNIVADENGEENEEMSDGQTPWKQFEMLSSAPPDHAFYGSVPAQPSKAFLGRLQKEYRALSSSLPDSIIVRAYEDRTDLLRCLIIGPENTPYEDAPFVIDWMLDAGFPHSPPIAHFWSWTNGNGRVNPNLYEEGKVCLSILGTWAGDRNETWSAARSSLLQAFVSIQGLVLVKEPWFCEPAYEKLRGTEEGHVNSRLYNEKAYVLSRGFVRRALEIPLGGLESEVNWMYYTNGKLAKVLSHSHALIEKSKANPESLDLDLDLAVPRLTAGGILTLERTLAKLQALSQGRTLK
ncbi:hypothetical protein SERLA73DRAFT_164742 [Serpula lacrymans var. lacrymans S7.3]|uniref:UBC core domain-containing protein n=1 Tax=Serpula lacrymans var. lacrymans (strain S7.3) TaxID=936435 RepID=F8PIE9_SERL3|nr:hypothetical protein SERLA73DRAFT_164742 [Serpula lacrymans var. lacrymans S7.3]